MKTKNNIRLMSLIASTMLLSFPSMAKTTIYDNSATAHNINMLTDTFISYAHKGETLSDLFSKKIVYGTMTRVDEYGDDGTTLKNNYVDNKNSSFLIKNVWADLQHINEHAHYVNGHSERTRFYMPTVGANTKSIDLKYGDIYFGAFAGYINSNTGHIDSNGVMGGIFAHYNFQRLGSTVLANIGSLNNDSGDTNFNNSWTNVAADIDAKFYIDKTFLVRPSLSVAYTFVSSDDLYVNNDIVWSKNFNFLNITPSVEFIKQIVPDWYGVLSAKYIAHFGGNNDIHIAHTVHDGIDMDDYTDLGLGIEYDFRQFVFGGQVHAQIGGFDGWSGNLNIKYHF